MLETTRRSSARFDIVSSFNHLALDRVELDQLRRIVSVDGDAPIVSSFDHLALDRVEFDQLRRRLADRQRRRRRADRQLV